MDKSDSDHAPGRRDPTIEGSTPPTRAGHTRRWHVQKWYAASALLCSVLALPFFWQLARGFEPGALLFALICLGIGLWQWRAFRTQVATEGDRLVIHAPLSSTRRIEFGQLLDVVQEGRVNPTLLIMYHPRAADGRIDLDDVQTVTLPALQEQSTLLERLEGYVPR